MNTNTKEKSLNIVVVDDHPVFRMGLVNVLKKIPSFGSILQAGNGKEVIELLKGQNFDMIFLDIDMPEMNGVEVMKYIKLHHPELKVIVMTYSINKVHILEMYKMGTLGYLMKTVSYKELKHAISLFEKGQQYYCPESAKIIFDSIKGMSDGSYSGSGEVMLSERELEVLMLICQQFSSVEIAEKLYLSSRTVERHRSTLIEKTGSKNTSGLVVYAYKNGLITL
ncbi:MAG: response regulator transcription factor [Bacteroidetes bacterium]|nr:response regulator transcription factor [Bacteroidota bacterium]